MLILLGDSILIFPVIPYKMQSAGAKKQWIPSDVDLDALEPEELDELVSLTTDQAGFSISDINHLVSQK